jgi:hypothetical protein
MIIKIEKAQEEAKNKYLSWSGNVKDVLKFMSTINSDELDKKQTDGHWMWHTPDNKVPEGIKTNLTEDYYGATHLWWIKAKYLNKRFRLPMSIACFFSCVSPANLLEMNEPAWIFLTKEERELVLQTAAVIKDKDLVKNLLNNPLFSDFEAC